MDESAYRSARDAAVPSRCVFEPALHAGCAQCSVAVRRALAEREAIGCGSAAAHERCAAFEASLRERAAFVLRRPPGEPWPHATTIRLACGGLAGVRRWVDQGDADVARLLAAAASRLDGLTDLPWPDIVAAVAAWPVRRRTAGGPR